MILFLNSRVQYNRWSSWINTLVSAVDRCLLVEITRLVTWPIIVQESSKRRRTSVRRATKSWRRQRLKRTTSSPASYHRVSQPASTCAQPYIPSGLVFWPYSQPINIVNTPSPTPTLPWPAWPLAQVFCTPRPFTAHVQCLNCTCCSVTHTKHNAHISIDIKYLHTGIKEVSEAVCS